MSTLDSIDTFVGEKHKKLLVNLSDYLEENIFKPAYIILHGAKGVGKTRILDELDKFMSSQTLEFIIPNYSKGDSDGSINIDYKELGNFLVSEVTLPESEKKKWKTRIRIPSNRREERNKIKTITDSLTIRFQLKGYKEWENYMQEFCPKQLAKEFWKNNSEIDNTNSTPIFTIIFESEPLQSPKFKNPVKEINPEIYPVESFGRNAAEEFTRLVLTNSRAIDQDFPDEDVSKTVSLLGGNPTFIEFMVDNALGDAQKNGDLDQPLPSIIQKYWFDQKSVDTSRMNSFLAMHPRLKELMVKDLYKSFMDSSVDFEKKFGGIYIEDENISYLGQGSNQPVRYILPELLRDLYTSHFRNLLELSTVAILDKEESIDDNIVGTGNLIKKRFANETNLYLLTCTHVLWQGSYRKSEQDIRFSPYEKQIDFLRNYEQKFANRIDLSEDLWNVKNEMGVNDNSIVDVDIDIAVIELIPSNPLSENHELALSCALDIDSFKCSPPRHPLHNLNAEPITNCLCIGYPQGFGKAGAQRKIIIVEPAARQRFKIQGTVSDEMHGSDSAEIAEGFSGALVISENLYVYGMVQARQTDSATGYMIDIEAIREQMNNLFFQQEKESNNEPE